MRETTVIDHIRFFEDQVKIMEDDYRAYYNAPLSQLFAAEEAFFGTVVGINNSSGHLIVKFKKNGCPRLKLPLNFVVVRAKAWEELGPDIANWGCTCKHFCENKEYHTVYSELKPLYFLKRDDEIYDYVGCGSVRYDLYNSIGNALKNKKEVWIVAYHQFPPTQYMLNLRNFSEWETDVKRLLVRPRILYDEWKPIELDSTGNIHNVLIETLDKSKICLLQGPPGTGKSYTIAQIVSHYLSKDKTVCVATMSNKGLTELISQEPLKEFLKNGAIKKTNLTSEESKDAPGLKLAEKDLIAAKGELLCTTFYTLSSKYSRVDSAPANPIYDLMVIEEASQAFLTTIRAFQKLGSQTLIVGDPMQLPPIILQENKSDYSTWDLASLVNGLLTVALGDDIPSYRIVTTYRLTSSAAALTGIFYSNQLKSVQKETVIFENMEYPSFFPKEGGTILFTTVGAEDIICSSAALKLMGKIVNDILSKYNKRSIAIISPFRDSVKRIQKEFYCEAEENEITVDTIDRIQGMTVDYTILYFPQRFINFALNENRFNVATSRSRSTTLIISDLPLTGFRSIDRKIGVYLNRCRHISDDAMVEPQNNISSSPKDEIIKEIPGIKVVGKIDLSKFEKPKKEIKCDKNNYYVIDTNVFLDYPDIITKIDKKYPIILSAKVVDELDKMKITLNDENKKSNAEKALRNLNKERNHEIKFEVSDLDLLPPDYNKKSPDNMIISVALKYKHENPILLTSDNGLQLMCKALNITSISLKDFIRQTKH